MFLHGNRNRMKPLANQIRAKSPRLPLRFEQLESRILLTGNGTLASPFIVNPTGNQAEVISAQPVYAQVTLTSSGSLTAKLQPSVGLTTRLSLVDSTGKTLVQSDGQVGDPADLITQSLPAGTYLLESQQLSGVAGNATLTTTFAAGNPASQDIPVDNGPRPILSGDFDGNGRLDLATINYYANTVSVLLGNGDGTFQTAVSYAVGQRPIAAVVGDFGNGHLDLAVANSSDNTVSVLLGNGDGTFQPAVSYSVGALPYKLVLADFGNGHLDLATANDVGGSVSVLLGNGDGTFQTATSYGVGNLSYDSHDLLVGDFGNGHLDLATTNQLANSVSILLGNGNGTFQAATSYTVNSPMHLAAGDFGRGHLDIATTDGNNTVSVLPGNGDGTFQSATEYAVGYGPDSLVLADFGNGHLDIATANTNPNVGSTVSVLLGNGNGTFQSAVNYAVAGTPYTLVARDFGNGRVDLATANEASGGVFNYSTVSVLLGNGDGTFQSATSYAVGATPYSMVVGDFGNGHLDLATANFSDNSVTILLGLGDGYFQTSAPYGVGPGPYALAVGDFGNGHVDLATANHLGNTVSVMLGNGDGTFQRSISYIVGRAPSSIVTADFNHDGRLDLATANVIDNTVSVLLGNGDGTFQSAVSYAVGSLPYTLLARDLGNGQVDLVTANINSGDISVLRGNGDGTFQAAASYAVGGSPGSLVAGDFGNGHLDLATANQSDNTVSVLLGNGDGTFQAAVAYAVGAAPVALLAANLGNGQLDLITANGAAGTASVLLGNGDGTFRSAVSYAAGSNPHALAAVDLGNGHVDLAVENYRTGVSVLLGNGDGTFQTATSYAVGATDNLVAADFGNGHIDLAVGDYFGNTVSILPGNGNGTFQTASSYAVGTGPFSFVAADLGNGALDLATANYGNNTVSILLGTGSGSFLSSTSATPQQSTPLLADLNGDGALDSVIVNQNGMILYRPGVLLTPGTFGAALVVNPTDPARAAAIVSTSQGYLIAALDNATNTVSLYRRNADNTFTRVGTLPVGNVATRIVAGNFRSNTNPLNTDLAVYNSGDGTVTIFLSNGAGGFSAPTTIAVGVGESDMALSPDPTSGAPDLVFSDQLTGQITVLVNNGRGVFTPVGNEFRAGLGPYGFDIASNTVSSLLRTVGLATGDFNGDGKSDTIAINAGGDAFGLLMGQNGGSFLNPISASLGFSPTAIAAGQFTRQTDNYLSIAVLDHAAGTVTVFLNNGAGGFQKGSSYQVGTDATAVTTRDVNNDGFPDLLIGNKYGDILVLQGVGDGTFKPFVRVGQSVPFVTKDLGNGVPSVILANQSLDNVLAQIRQAGTTSFTVGSFQQYRQNGLIGPGFITLGQLTNSGFDDLIVANTDSNNVLVYLGTGTNTFSTTPLSFFAGTNPVHLAVGDLNGDSIPDLAVANQGSNDVSILLGTGTASLFRYGPRLNSGGIGTNHVSIGNYNGDTVPDLLVTNGQSGTMTMLPGIGSSGQGTGFFNDTTPGSVNLGGGIASTVAFGPDVLALRQDGSIFSVDPTNFALQQVFGASNVTALAAPVGSSLVVARGDDSLSMLTEDSTGHFSDSLDFRDARLDDPSALQLIGNEIYVTNAGSNEPIIIELSAGIPVALLEGGAGRGQETGVQSAGNEFTLVAVVTTGQSETVTAILESGIDSSLVAGLGSILSVPTVGTSFENAGSGSVEDDEWLATATPTDVESTGNAWSDLVFGIWQAVQERSQEAQGELLNYHFESLPESLRPSLIAVAPALEGVPLGMTPVLRESLQQINRAIFSVGTENSTARRSIPESLPAEETSGILRATPHRVLPPPMELKIDIDDRAWWSDRQAQLPAIDLPRSEIASARLAPPQDQSAHDLAWAGLLAVLLPRRKEKEDRPPTRAAARMA